MKHSSPKGLFFAWAVPLILLPALFSRICAVLYSGAATNILYSETALPEVLSWLRQIFSAISFGGGVASVVYAAYTFGRSVAVGTAALHVCILLADVSAAFLIDAISGAVSGALLMVAALMNLGDWLFSALLVTVGALLVGRRARRGKGEAGALRLFALVYFSGRILLRLIYMVQFLVEVEFAPYSQEIVQMVGEILETCFISGAVWLSGVGMHAWLSRRLAPAR